MCLYLVDHLDEILVVDAAELQQAGMLAPRQQIQMLDQCLHGWVVAVALLQLQSEAFGERAGEDAGRLEILQQCQHRLDARQRAAELLRQRGEVAAQIAVVVELVDQARTDRPLRGVGGLDVQLQNGRASCRERGCQYVEISGVAVRLKKKKK